MKKLYLVIDSCCNIDRSFIEERDYIKVIGMPVDLDGENFIDYFDQYISKEEFYKRLSQGSLSKTSLITPSRFKELFESLSDREIHYICLSSGMSGTMEAAIAAKNELKDQKIYIHDSMLASVGCASLVRRLVEELEKNSELDIDSFVKENRAKVCTVLFVEDLDYLKRGGRIPPALAGIAKILNLKPIMRVDSANDGKLVPITKVRGRKKAIQFIKDEVESKFTPNTKYLYVAHSASDDEANELGKYLKEKYNREVFINEESPTIGSHVGPGFLIVSFLGE